MTTEVQGWNIALGVLGQTALTISSIDPSNTTMSAAARKLLPFRQMCVDMTLEEHDWLEASQPVILQPLSVSGNYAPWNYVYGLPLDFMRMGDVTTCDSWRLGTHLSDDGTRRRVIFAKAQITEASCVVRLSWDLMSAHLAMLCALRLASLGCEAVTADDKLSQIIEQKLQATRMAAYNNEAFNSAEEPPVENLGLYRRQAL